MTNPADVLHALGWRYLVVPDLRGAVVVVDSEHLVLIDDDLDHDGSLNCALDLIADAIPAE